MKKLFIALLCLLLVGLWACVQAPEESPTSSITTTSEEAGQTINPIETTTTIQVSENDPFYYVLSAYAELVQNPRRARRLSNMDEQQRREQFAQGFEMLQEEAFLSFEFYLLEESEVYYAFYDTDNNGAMALILRGRGILDIYTIQNDVAVQAKSFYFARNAEFGTGVWLLETGIIQSGDIINNRFYRFEDGLLKFQGALIQGTGNMRHILADGSETIVTWDESLQLIEDYGEGNWNRAQLDWQPLAEFGR